MLPNVRGLSIKGGQAAHIPEPKLKKTQRKMTAKETKKHQKDGPTGSSPQTDEEVDLWAAQLAVRGILLPKKKEAEAEAGGTGDSHKISRVPKPTKEIKEKNNHVEKEMVKKVAIQPAIQPKKKRPRDDGEAEQLPANFEEVGKLELGKRKRKGSDGQETSEPSAASPCFRSIKDSQALISRFHTLQKYLAAVDVDPTLLSEAAREKRRCEIRGKLEALGGLDAYQKASIFGATADESGGFNSGVWVKNELRHMGLLPPRSPARLRLLDVGAVQDHWSPHATTVDAMAIDLNPQHPSVRRADFFDFPPLPKDSSEAFDALVLSLVLNFVGDPRRRGAMLERCAALLRPGGALFLVLPAACITNSRYMKHALLLRILRVVGFELASHKLTPKLALYAFTRSIAPAAPGGDAGAARALASRKLCRGGQQRNNFAIILGGGGGGGGAKGGRDSGQGGRRAEREGPGGGGEAVSDLCNFKAKKKREMKRAAKRGGRSPL
jgi:25S rRNA (adenine2142-N1)-methyltransferase